MPVFELTELPDAIPRGAPIMGLDLGEKTIGVATSDVGLMIATPTHLLRKTKFTTDAEALLALMQARDAAALVIGLPVNMDGTEGPRCQSVRAFARNLLRLRPDLPIAFWDERLSTAAVNRMLVDEADVSRHRREELDDKAAAARILQGALDRLRGV